MPDKPRTLAGIKGQKARGRPPIKREIKDWIAVRVAMGQGAAQIHADLLREPKFRERPPTDRSVRRIVERLLKEDASEWHLANARADDASLVLPVLAELIKQSYGPGPRLRTGLVKWIVLVRRAAPDISPSWALDVALNYWRLTAEDVPTHGLDELLAFAPWRSAETYWDYLNEMGRLHREWFDGFKRQERGHPLGGFKLAAMESDPMAWGLLLAVMQHARGRVPPPARRQKGESHEARKF